MKTLLPPTWQMRAANEEEEQQGLGCQSSLVCESSHNLTIISDKTAPACQPLRCMAAAVCLLMEGKCTANQKFTLQGGFIFTSSKSFCWRAETERLRNNQQNGKKITYTSCLCKAALFFCMCVLLSCSGLDHI